MKRLDDGVPAGAPERRDRARHDRPPRRLRAARRRAARRPRRPAVPGRDLARRDRSAARVRPAGRRARRPRSAGRRRRRARRSARSATPRALAAARAPVLEHADAATRFDVAYALAELGDPTRPRRARRRARRPRARVGRRDRARRRSAAPTTPRRSPRAREQADAARGDACSPPARCSRSPPTGPHDDAARRVLLAALGARKTHVRGLAVEQLGAVGGAWAKAPLEKLARTGKGAELLEAIAAALRAIDAAAEASAARSRDRSCSTRTPTSTAPSSTPIATTSSRARAPPACSASIVIGAVGDPTSAERSVALAERDPDIWATVATHPHDVEKMTPDVVGGARAARAATRASSRSARPASTTTTITRRARRSRPRSRRFIELAHARAASRSSATSATRTTTRARSSPPAAPASSACVIHCFTGTPDDARAYADARLLRLVLRHRHLQDRPAAARRGAARAPRSAPDRDRLPLPGTDPQARKAQRTGLRDPHRRGRRDVRRHEFRGVSSRSRPKTRAAVLPR